MPIGREIKVAIGAKGGEHFVTWRVDGGAKVLDKADACGC